MTRMDLYLRANLKLRQLHLLVALDDFRNVGKAATSLNITQPAISKSLAELEKGLEIKLFERTARGVHPTIYGECLIAHARTVLAELTQARDNLHNLMSGAAGNVSIGALSTAVHALLPQSLALLKQRSPNTSALVREGTMEELLSDLWSGKLDLIVGRLSDGRPTPGLEKRILAEDTVTLVSGLRHPLVGRKPLRWSDLHGFPWVLPPVGTLLRGPLERAFQRHALPMPANRVETLSTHLLCSYLQATDAIAFLGGGLSKHYQDLGMIAILPLELPKLLRPVEMMWSRQRPLSPSTRLMVQCLEAGTQSARPTDIEPSAGTMQRRTRRRKPINRIAPSSVATDL